MNTIKIKIDGMSNLACAKNVLRALSSVPGVRDVQVALGEASVNADQASSPELLLHAVAKAGRFRAEIVQPVLPVVLAKSPHLLGAAFKAISLTFSS